MYLNNIWVKFEYQGQIQMCKTILSNIYFYFYISPKDGQNINVIWSSRSRRKEINLNVSVICMLRGWYAFDGKAFLILC